MYVYRIFRIHENRGSIISWYYRFTRLYTASFSTLIQKTCFFTGKKYFLSGITLKKNITPINEKVHVFAYVFTVKHLHEIYERKIFHHRETSGLFRSWQCIAKPTGYITAHKSWDISVKPTLHTVTKMSYNSVICLWRRKQLPVYYRLTACLKL